VAQTNKLSNTSQQALLEALMDSIPDLIFYKDQQSIYLGCNIAFAGFVGIDKDSIIGKTDFDLFPKDVAEFFRKMDRAMLASGKARRNEEWVDFPDGSRVLLDTLKTPYYSPDDKLIGLIGISRDITARSNAETFIKQTADILEMIATGKSASSIYDAIALMYEARHPGMRCSMLELKGDTLIHGGAPSLPVAYCNAVNGLKNGPSVGSCGTSTYTGERVLVEDIASDPKWGNLKDVALPFGLRSCWSEPIKNADGKVLGAFGMYYNHPALPDKGESEDLDSAARLAGIVMEREHNNSLLRKLHSSFEYAQDAIIISDLDSRVEYVNPAFEKMTGYPAEEILGQYIKVLRSNAHPLSFYDNMQETVRQGKVWRGELIIRCKDGSLREVERNIAPVLDEHGNLLCQVNIQRDITEHKKLEEQFRQAQKMEAIGTLVGGIAHDFNNILAGITCNTFLAKELVGSIPDAESKLSNIEQLSFRAADTIQQLLTFARKDMVRKKNIPLNPFIKETLKLFRTSIPENIELHQDICDQPLEVYGDSTQIHQVLMNLVNNARDAVAEVDNPSITLRLEPFDADEAFTENHLDFVTGSYAHLMVEDNGCGIPEHQIEHVLEPFFTTKEQGKGTGLGLAMTFGAIKTHHGHIEILSDVGKGSAFHIYLPLPKAEETVPAAPQEEEIVRGHGETILLVDDDARILESGEEVLETLGYHILTATNGLQAIEVFKKHSEPIDLCIFDIVMPVMGGDKAAASIRQSNPLMKIIFSSGYDMNVWEGMSGETIISKPFSVTEMSHLIRQQLDA